MNIGNTGNSGLLLCAFSYGTWSECTHRPVSLAPGIFSDKSLPHLHIRIKK